MTDSSNPLPATSSGEPLATTAPEQLEPTGALELAEPTGAPSEFGLPPDCTPLKKAVWDRQEMFLRAFQTVGRKHKAATMAGINYYTVAHWQREDVLGFNTRVKTAHQVWCENFIEARIDDRLSNPQGNRGSDVLLMFQAKAEMPEKYREDVKLSMDTGVSQLLGALRQAARTQAPLPPAADAQIRELPPETG